MTKKTGCSMHITVHQL